MADRRNTDDQFESYEKPTRAIRKGGKKKGNKDRMERGPKEHYKRERLTRNDFLSKLDDEE